jgi:hypothetical protein
MEGKGECLEGEVKGVTVMEGNLRRTGLVVCGNKKGN